MASPDNAAPVPTTLPEAPSRGFYNKTQWDVLNALVDAVLPSIATKSALGDEDGRIAIGDQDFDKTGERTIQSLSSSISKESVVEFLAHRPSEDPRFADNFLRTIAMSPPSRQQQLGGLLSLMA